MTMARITSIIEVKPFLRGSGIITIGSTVLDGSSRYKQNLTVGEVVYISIDALDYRSAINILPSHNRYFKIEPVADILQDSKDKIIYRDRIRYMVKCIKAGGILDIRVPFVSRPKEHRNAKLLAKNYLREVAPSQFEDKFVIEPYQPVIHYTDFIFNSPAFTAITSPSNAYNISLAGIQSNTKTTIRSSDISNLKSITFATDNWHTLNSLTMKVISASNVEYTELLGTWSPALIKKHLHIHRLHYLKHQS